ncbi:exodeoxyribonuclease V subunit alpha [Solicola sp. PLA-1-18]|uniref:exodeoxyribonuclease V subunit alpha n=1 Tax=Solicola sp. PLA-1-18 TaxID=3380532 RepID=UPI003B7B09C7
MSLLDDPHHVHRARGATGVLATFNDAGVLEAADVHVARRLERLGPETDEAVLLAVALAVRAVRHGSVCLELSTAQEVTVVDEVDGTASGTATDDLPWPDVDAWLAALRASVLVADGLDGPADRPLRLVGGALYLDRYWRQEHVIADAVDSAALREPPAVDAARLAEARDRLFDTQAPDRQRLAAVVAAHRWVSVLAGGPGTGKTTTVARLVALLQDQAEVPLRVALAAPTASAAARLQESVAYQAEQLPEQDAAHLAGLSASTLHRLLGWRPGARTRFRHDHDNPLPFDLVVVDEASMVALTMMSRLVDALRPSTRLVLVGDPDQLASVDAGAVLGDLVQRPAPPDAAPPAGLDALVAADIAGLDDAERSTAISSGVVRLSTVHRHSGTILDLATAIRLGDVDGALAALDRGDDEVELLDPASAEATDDLHRDVVGANRDLLAAARVGDATTALAALGRHRLLCAHRDGPWGVSHWTGQVEQWLAEALPGYARDGYWYVGRPLIVTSNDYQLRLYNGDTGVVVEHEGRVVSAFRRDGGFVLVPTSRLSDVRTVHASSVHSSQGGQFEQVTLVLPTPDSPLLTRELLYTAVTRAQKHVRVIGTPDAVATAVERPIVRASGLRTRRA